MKLRIILFIFILSLAAWILLEVNNNKCLDAVTEDDQLIEQSDAKIEEPGSYEPFMDFDDMTYNDESEYDYIDDLSEIEGAGFGPIESFEPSMDPLDYDYIDITYDDESEKDFIDFDYNIGDKSIDSVMEKNNCNGNNCSAEKLNPNYYVIISMVFMVFFFNVSKYYL